MRRHRFIRLTWTMAAAVGMVSFGATRAPADDVVVVKVEGQGLDKDGAIKDALRKAIERGGQNEIASRSQTKDFALEYDVVLARASGLVKDYKVLRESSGSGIFTAEIEAKVSKSLLDATWADVAIELKKLGRPKIMVLFREAIHDMERPEGSREVVQNSSQTGVYIERKLMKLGFKVVNPGALKEIERKKAEVAAAENDTETLKALATSYGAAIVLKGDSRASGPQKTNTPAGTLNMWESDVTIQGFWTETGDGIFSNAVTSIRGGSRVAGPAGATQTLNKTGEKLADQSIYDLLEAWTRGTAGGVGDIIVEVRNVGSIKQGLAIKKALAEVKGVEEVTKEGAKGTVKFTVVTAMSAEEFVEHVVEMAFDDFEWEVEDQKTKTIICVVKG
ncbi:MAG: hypothetical protein KF841_12080 [Phycisphaerae bacterium]|nr:hypothetical protein [Phycisphaerae bacterium]